MTRPGCRVGVWAGSPLFFKIFCRKYPYRFALCILHFKLLSPPVVGVAIPAFTGNKKLPSFVV
jgi:hypothetical protein